MLCYGIVDKPLKCDKCETIYCSKCIPDSKKAPGKFNCYNKCRSKTKNCVELSKFEMSILMNLKFSCQNDECEEKISYGSYSRHMTRDCKVKIYKKAIFPDGAFDSNKEESILSKHLKLNGGYNILCGDLFYLFYNQEDEIKDEYQRL